MKDNTKETGENPNTKKAIPTPSLNISELQETKCSQVSNNHILVCCEPIKRYMGGCLSCGSMSYYVHGSKKDRIVHDISMGIVHVDLLVKVPRYRCNDCGSTFMYPLGCIVEGTKFTSRLYNQIVVRALDESFATIAKEYGASTTTIAKIFVDYYESKERDRKLTAPKVLGIDEKHIVHKKRGVFVDVENSKIIEMTDTNQIPTMKQTIESMDGYENIRVVTIDMYRGYCNLVKECLPQAKIVIDKFHVIQALHKRIHKARKSIIEYLKTQISDLRDDEEKTRKESLMVQLKKDGYLFKYGIKELQKRKERVLLLAELCETFPELNTLRLLKEDVENIYNAVDRATAEKLYQMWKQSIPRKNPLFSEILAFQKTVERWKEYIFNYFDEGCRFTNAATEGFNSLIGNINNVGRGYKFKTLRLKVIYHANATDLPSNKLTKKDLLNLS